MRQLKRLMSTAWSVFFPKNFRHNSSTRVDLKTSQLAEALTKSLLLVILFFIVLQGLMEPEFDELEEYRNDISIPYQRFSHRIRNISKMPVVYLATAACSSRFSEAITMLKSAMIFSKDVHLYVIVFADRRNLKLIDSKLNQLVDAGIPIGVSMSYEIYPIWLRMKNAKTWNLWFAPCSSQRLFFPQALPHIKRLIYVDTDVLFVSNILDLWRHVVLMEPRHLGGAAPEHELPGDGWYNVHSKIPYYGPRGLNTGILLMNIEAMRSFPFEEVVNSIYHSYADRIKWADQDILNILFYMYPERFYALSCAFNYRVQHCACDFPESGSCACQEGEKSGVSVLHGNRHTFHSDRTKAEHFKMIYENFEKFEIGQDERKLLADLQRTYTNLDPSQPCRHLSSALFDRFEAYTRSQNESVLRKIFSKTD